MSFKLEGWGGDAHIMDTNQEYGSGLKRHDGREYFFPFVRYLDLFELWSTQVITKANEKPQSISPIILRDTFKYMK